MSRCRWCKRDTALIPHTDTCPRRDLPPPTRVAAPRGQAVAEILYFPVEATPHYPAADLMLLNHLEARTWGEE